MIVIFVKKKLFLCNKNIIIFYTFYQVLYIHRIARNTNENTMTRICGQYYFEHLQY